MVGRYATPEADLTITHHLPPPEDDSTEDISMSFVIPPQADASNLLDQNCDDFFSGPGFVTLSTPVPPRRLADTRRSVSKVTGTIQTPAVSSGPILGRTLTTNPTPELEASDNRAELQETHIPPNPSLLLSPPLRPFMSMSPPMAASAVGTDPDSPRPDEGPSGRFPGVKLHAGPKSNTAPPVASIITKASGTQPGIQSTSTSVPSRHSADAQNTQISRRLPIPASRKKEKEPGQARGNTSVKSSRATSKPRSGGGPDCETTTSTQTRIRGGAAGRMKPTLFNRPAKGGIESGPATSTSRGNFASYVPPMGSEHSDPGSLGDPAESYRAVTQNLVTPISPPSESSQSRLNLESGRVDSTGSPPFPGPSRTAEDHVGAKIPQEAAEEERQDGDPLTVSQLSPSKTVSGCPENSESSEWNDNGIRQSPTPTSGTPIAVSPMRPSRKRVSSAGRESDIEPGSAWPDEWEERYLITESNREGEVRGREGKSVPQARRTADGEKALVQPSDKKNGVASRSLTLTRRLKAKAVRQSPRARKLRDKLGGRVGNGDTGRGRTGIGIAPKIPRGGQAVSNAFRFSENTGTSTTASVVRPEGKGRNRSAADDVTTGPTMPYIGDNQQGGVINRSMGSVVGEPSFRSILKRSTVPVEFRFELTARLDATRRSAAKENPGPGASSSGSREDGREAAGRLRKRPKLEEPRGTKDGVDGSEGLPSSSRLSEAKDDHHDQTGSHVGAWRGGTRSGSSTASMSRSKRRAALMVPEAFSFSTEQRAKDRERFDEAVRVKQKEKERRVEEERAARAVEEERGIKEMRKRAVPKANTVPEWYATMPKRGAA